MISLTYIFFIYLLLFSLSLIQSLAGVGVLVLGTPIFLILNFNIIDTMKILLPISILTSFTCSLITKSFYKNIIPNYNTLKYFFLICIPSIFIGIQILKYYSDLINFKYLVLFLIFFSLFIKIKFKKININKKYFKKNIIFFIGIIHGITNSGGTLLSLFFLNIKKKETINNIFNIHWFYFLLALIQITILNINFSNAPSLKLNYFYLAIIVLMSSFFGTFLLKKIHKRAKQLVYILALFSAITLLIF